MSSAPLISVCIPSYNNERFIASTLTAILNQTHEHFEVIITDDHSTDGTVAEIGRFADPRIQLIRNDANLGIGTNWNKALSHASGKYVKLVCGDDVIYPDCLARQVQALEDPANARAALAVCGSDVLDADGEIIFHRRSRCGAGRVSGRDLIRKSVRRGTNIIGEPAVGLFRRQLLPLAGMFDPGNPYLIDLAFWAGLLKHGDAFVDPCRLAAFRVSAASVSTQVGLNQAAYFRSFVRSVRHDPFYRASLPATVAGYVLSFQWCLLRHFLTCVLTRKASYRR